MSTTTMLDLEARDIELQLQEIQLKRKQLEIERERLNKKENTHRDIRKPAYNTMTIPHKKGLYLHYSKHVMDYPMRIADVCPDGSILVRHGKDTHTVSKKYSMKTLAWIKQKLPVWVNLQRESSYFWDKLAEKYSKKFLPKDESISRTTMKKLCYMVDSGNAEVWFEKYNVFKGKGKQVTLDEG